MYRYFINCYNEETGKIDKNSGILAAASYSDAMKILETWYGVPDEVRLYALEEVLDNYDLVGLVASNENLT